MRRMTGPDFGGIREAMDRITLIHRRIYGAPLTAQKSFDGHLAEAQETEKTPVVSGEKTEVKLSGSASVLKSRLSNDCAHIDSAIEEISSRYGVDEKLVRSVISVESAWRPDAVSPKGAIGLMQLMPGTARMLSVDPKDPVQNVEGGVKYLAQLSEKYSGDLEKTLAAYNAGPGRVDQYGGIPPFKETEAYVKRVLKLYNG